MRARSDVHYGMNGDIGESEFPVAVLCARCGRPDCAGCLSALEDARAPDVPSWEAGEAASFGQLWQTAHRSVTDGEVFFATLPDGRLGRALSFAFTCELLAVASLVAGWCGALFIVAPSIFGRLWEDDEIRQLLIGSFLFSIPAFAGLMVLLHIVWGVSIELGLRLQGSPRRISHALRYALYSCGWDLLTSPFGFIAAAVAGGLRQAIRDVRFAVRIPRLATHAFLTKARSADEDQARRALWTAAAITGSLVVAAAATGITAALFAAFNPFEGHR